MKINAIRDVPSLASYKKGDFLVLFGELFARGYANGLVEQAEKQGLNIIYSTVGRREKDGSLRALLAEEIPQVKGHFINVPLEAGFDMEKVGDITPCDLLKDLKMTNWHEAKLDFKLIEEAKNNSIDRFQKQVTQWSHEVQKIIPPGANVIFAHLMAGGVPRAKICMPAMNRVFKGQGDRYFSSKEFWDCDLGKLMSLNFKEVTANTLEHLINGTENIRKASQAQVSYIAYGYHGTEVMIEDQLMWQSYAPYLQGWAKMDLEKIAEKHFAKNIFVSVYNSPEIMTHSSGIFQGVELPLYELLKSIKQYAPEKSQKVWNTCQSKLKPGMQIKEVLKICDAFLSDPYIKEQYDFALWPHHSRQKQLEMTLTVSNQINEMHTTHKDEINSFLSEIIFSACGYLMLNLGLKPQAPVHWIGHDIVARVYNQLEQGQK